MRLSLILGAALLAAAPAGAQDVAATAAALADELAAGPPDAIEVYAAQTFFPEWEFSAREATGIPMPVSGDGMLPLLPHNIAAGLHLFREALANTPGFADHLDEMLPRVLEQARDERRRIGTLSLEDAAKLYVLAQSMKGAAGSRVGNDDPKFCLFIDYCLEGDGPFGRP